MHADSATMLPAMVPPLPWIKVAQVTLPLTRPSIWICDSVERSPLTTTSGLMKERPPEPLLPPCLAVAGPFPLPPENIDSPLLPTPTVARLKGEIKAGRGLAVTRREGGNGRFVIPAKAGIQLPPSAN